jgi:tetratricopeptide (TPR) repeat protein
MKILLLGLGNAPVRYCAISVMYDNFLKRHMGKYEIITFGYNSGVDIQIDPGDEFERVIEALPTGWVPDLCILPWIDQSLLPRGIEHAPFTTVATLAPGDWDFDVIYAKAITKSVDITVGGSDYDKIGLTLIGANQVELFYPGAIMKEFFDPNPKKIKDRKYDIFYSVNWFNDESHPERSNWLLKLASLATKHKVLITSRISSYSEYMKILSNSKLAFSTVRTGAFSPRVLDAAVHGAVPVVTGEEVKKYFVHGEEIINVNEDNFSELIGQFLEDERALQQMSDNVYKKALEFESRKRFFQFVKFAKKAFKPKKFARKINSLSDHEKHIRKGEIYYYAFFGNIWNGYYITNNSPDRYAHLCIEEFKKAVNIKRTPRSLTNLAVAKIAFSLWYKKEIITKEIKESIGILKDVISLHPMYTMAYYHLGLVHWRTKNFAEAKNVFNQALNLFGNKEGHVDPWCLQNRDMELFNSIIRTPLNRELILLHRGEEKKAMENIRNLYRSAVFYYLSLIEEDIFKKLEFLAQSYILHPNSGLISHELAKTLSLLGFREEGIMMYEHTISLLPLDVDKRIEYIKLLYYHKMDKKLVDEIKSLSSVIKITSLLKKKEVDLNIVMNSFARLDANSLKTEFSLKK